jgi:F0F1-type ATP synthase delta subunit
MNTEFEDARLACDKIKDARLTAAIPMKEKERETVMESIERSQGESVGLKSLGC